MENHREKLAIFDQYAQGKGYLDFEDLIKELESYKTKNLLIKVILNATDLVQKEALKRGSEKLKTVVPGNFSEDLEYLSKEIKAFKQSILSDENLVK